MGPPDILFEANNKFKEDLKEVGLELQLKKSACYIDEKFRNEEWHRRRGSLPEGKLDKDDPNCTDFGIEVCNIPFGIESYIKGYLSRRQRRILKGFDKAKRLLDPATTSHPDIPTRQMLFLLTLACFQHQPDYWCRHLRPDYTGDFAAAIDEGVSSLVTMSTGLDIKNLPAFVQERMRLPISSGGGGLRSAHDRRYAQFVGGLTQCLPDFLDRSDMRGNTIEGRLNLPSIKDVLGVDSFSFPVENPLTTLLMKMPNSNLVKGLRFAWTQLKENVQEAGGSIDDLDDERHLLAMNENSMGFYKNGSQAESVTNALTRELEGIRARKAAKEAKEMDKNEPMRWAWEATKWAKSQWMHCPVDDLGYLPNRLYPSIWAQHLGVPDPALKGFDNFYFGMNGTKVDAYGNNLMTAALPGGGFKRLHNSLQYLISQIMETGGMITDREAENFLANKVPEKYMRRYNKNLSMNKAQHKGKQKAPDSITPDIQVHNYPVGKKGGNDSGAQSNTLPAIFEVKTFYPSNTRMGHNTNDTYNPGDRRAQGIYSEYRKKFEGLDKNSLPTLRK